MERQFGDFRAEAGTGSNIFGVRVHACARGRLGYNPGPFDGFSPPPLTLTFSAHLLQNISPFGWTASLAFVVPRFIKRQAWVYI